MKNIVKNRDDNNINHLNPAHKKINNTLRSKSKLHAEFSKILANNEPLKSVNKSITSSSNRILKSNIENVPTLKILIKNSENKKTHQRLKTETLTTMNIGSIRNALNRKDRKLKNI